MKSLFDEENKLKLIDLTGRLPYGVIVNTPKGDGYLHTVNLTIFGTEYGVNIDATKRDTFNDREDVIKPYLRPMSSMTEEEAKEIAILHDIKDILSVKVTSDYIDVIVDDGVCSTERRTIWYDEIVSSVKCFDLLTAHHFDYRNLIDKGLALKAPEGMYNLNK